MSSSEIHASIEAAKAEKKLKEADKINEEQDIAKLETLLTAITEISTSIEIIQTDLSNANEILPYAYRNDNKLLDNGKTEQTLNTVQNNSADIESLKNEVSTIIDEIKDKIEVLDLEISNLKIKISGLEAQYDAAVRAEAAAAESQSYNQTDKSDKPINRTTNNTYRLRGPR